MSPSRFVGAAAVIIVIAIIAAAFTAIGPPSRARAESLDRERVRDLADRAAGIYEDYGRGVRVPTAPIDLVGRDPVSGKAYEYRRISDNDYTLCAVFELPTPLTHTSIDVAVFWRHPAGRYCYRFDARRRVESTL